MSLGGRFFSQVGQQQLAQSPPGTADQAHNAYLKQASFMQDTRQQQQRMAIAQQEMAQRQQQLNAQLFARREQIAKEKAQLGIELLPSMLESEDPKVRDRGVVYLDALLKDYVGPDISRGMAQNMGDITAERMQRPVGIMPSNIPGQPSMFNRLPSGSVQPTPGAPMVPARLPEQNMEFFKTERGVMPIDPATVKSGEVIPGTEPPKGGEDAARGRVGEALILADVMNIPLDEALAKVEGLYREGKRVITLKEGMGVMAKERAFVYDANSNRLEVLDAPQESQPMKPTMRFNPKSGKLEPIQ